MTGSKGRGSTTDKPQISKAVSNITNNRQYNSYHQPSDANDNNNNNKDYNL